MKIHPFLFVCFSSIILSCCSNVYNEYGNEQGEQKKIIITPNDKMHSIQVYESLGEFGKYKSFCEKSDITIGISSARYYPLGEETIISFCDPKESADTKSQARSDMYSKIAINGIHLFPPRTNSTSGAIKRLFGSRAVFSISDCSQETKGGFQNGVEVYAPEIVRIAFPSVTSEDTRYPLCYYKDFVVRWNEDNLNSNGVIVLVRWNGIMAFGNNYNSSYVIRSICVPDNGSTILEESIFDGIPDTALCQLLILRGDVENTQYNDDTYRVLAESHDVLDFILIRNIKE